MSASGARSFSRRSSPAYSVSSVERLLIRPLYGGDPLYSLLLTFGLAYMMQDGIKYIWGAQSLPFQPPMWLMKPLSSDISSLPVTACS